MPHSECQLPGCGWISQQWELATSAGSEAAWHVYEEHRQVWNNIVGDRPPVDPDPR